MASNNMKLLSAGPAWDMAVENAEVLSINDEDRKVLQNLSKLLREDG